jgi:hypothetical protein
MPNELDELAEILKKAADKLDEIHKHFEELSKEEGV